jgi:hypothetical protein
VCDINSLPSWRLVTLNSGCLLLLLLLLLTLHLSELCLLVDSLQSRLHAASSSEAI